jgi:hypothetical protein
MAGRSKLGVRALLTLTIIAVLSWDAPVAEAASCGNSQPNALLLGCNNNNATDTTSLISLGPFGLDIYDNGASATALNGFGGYAGVHGEGSTYGVRGFSNYGTGVSGETVAENQNGVYGAATNASGSGVYGQNDGTGYGVAGRASNGTGVLADSANGVALNVTGIATFSRSGIATVPSGAKFIKVNMGGVTTSSMILATVQQGGGFYVRYALPASGSFKIYINKAPTSPTTVKVAYFVLN